MPILSPISESLFARTVIIGPTKPISEDILKSDRDQYLLHAQAPVKNPYKDPKTIIPTAFFTPKMQKIKIAQHMLHITIEFVTPYLFTPKFDATRPSALLPLRIVSCPMV